MIEEYRTAVQRAYQEKKAAGELSINLTNPTCANLRNECLSRFRAGCNKSDTDILREFFDIPYNQEICDQTIKRCDPDRFKPLINFLKKETKTHEKNIELLAWFINFQNRPSVRYYYSPYENQITAILNNTKPNPYYSEICSVEIAHEDAFTSKIKHSGPTSSLNYGQAELPQRNRTELVDRQDYFLGKREGKKEITIEYPSGAKLSVDASDLPLIAQLVRL